MTRVRPPITCTSIRLGLAQLHYAHNNKYISFLAMCLFYSHVMLRCCLDRRPADGLSRLSRRITMSAQLMCSCWLARCWEPIVADDGSENDWPSVLRPAPLHTPPPMPPPPPPLPLAFVNDGTARWDVGSTVIDARGELFQTASTIESMLADRGMRVLAAWSRLSVFFCGWLFGCARVVWG